MSSQGLLVRASKKVIDGFISRATPLSWPASGGSKEVMGWLLGDFGDTSVTITGVHIPVQKATSDRCWDHDGSSDALIGLSEQGPA